MSALQRKLNESNKHTSNMFKKLKDKIAEEVKSSPSRIQELAKVAQVIIVWATPYNDKAETCKFPNDKPNANEVGVQQPKHDKKMGFIK